MIEERKWYRYQVDVPAQQCGNHKSREKISSNFLALVYMKNGRKTSLHLTEHQGKWCLLWKDREGK
jgi:hypothetical protein